MNHRELVLSARRKASFWFLRLPESLQDQIIDGFDAGTMTLEAAAALIKSHGHSLSIEALSDYYRAVRTERRIADSKQELSRIIAEFAGKPHDEAIQGLVNLAIATAVSGLADGSVGIKNIDLSKMLQAMPSPSTPQPAAGDAANKPSSCSDPTSAQKLVEEVDKILGVTR